MNIIHYARAILEEANYETFEQSPSRNVFYFEDNSVLGFVKDCEDVSTILSSWESIQDSNLGMCIPSIYLRVSVRKSRDRKSAK